MPVSPNKNTSSGQISPSGESVNNLEYLKLRALVEKGTASPEASARFSAL